MNNNSFLPFALPEIGPEEIQEVTACLESGWLTTGPRTAQFERAFADYLGVPHALAVNSGTAGLHLALEAIGVGPGDLVITTPYTFTATAEVVRYLGAEPVFVDIDPMTFNLDPTLVEKKLAESMGQRAEGSGGEEEKKLRRLEDEKAGSRRSEVRGRGSEIGSRRSEIRGRES